MLGSVLDIVYVASICLISRRRFPHEFRKCFSDALTPNPQKRIEHTIMEQFQMEQAPTVLLGGTDPLVDVDPGRPLHLYHFASAKSHSA